MPFKLQEMLLCAAALVCAPDVGLSAVCTEANALSVLVKSTPPATATAYVPNGAWCCGTTGVRAVPLEGVVGPATAIATPNVVDSCAANSTTQQVVCTATNSDVYLMHGITLDATLTSAGTGVIGFSGGTCGNCGVAIDTTANIAWIEEAAPSNSAAVQSLNLANNTFGPQLGLANGISESIVVDPIHSVLLSAAEDSIYDIIVPPAEYGNSTVNAAFDASAEDCTTGLIIGTDEFTTHLYFADYNMVTFIAGTKWIAPQSLPNFPEFGHFIAGTTGISVAPNTHYAALEDEFGGNYAGFMKLPLPKHIRKNDYVVAAMPTDPNGISFQNGDDPHSLTTYISPNNGRAYAVLEDWADGAPDFLLVVDIAKILAAPRIIGLDTSGPHLVDPSYNLISHGVVHFVPTFPVTSNCPQPNECL